MLGQAVGGAAEAPEQLGHDLQLQRGDLAAHAAALAGLVGGAAATAQATVTKAVEEQALHQERHLLCILFIEFQYQLFA